MPIRKPHLNRAEQALYHAAAQELHSAGLDVDVPGVQDSHFLDVAVAGGPATGAFDLPNAGVGYAICVRLVAMRSGLILSHYQIRTKWDDQISPLNFDERSPVCKLGWFTYSRDEVLNQHLDNSLQFHYRGQVIEGTILAMGLQPIPEMYRTGASVPFEINFADSLGHEIGVEAELYVDRTAKRKNATARKGTALFEPSGTLASRSAVVREGVPCPAPTGNTPPPATAPGDATVPTGSSCSMHGIILPQAAESRGINCR